MGNSKYLLSATVVLLAICAAQPAFGQKTAQPNATFLLGGEIFASGQSDNLGPVTNQILSDYWIAGECPDDESYRYCDDLRFGLTMSAAPSCTLADADSGGCASYNEVVVEPHEDGGADTQNQIKGMQNEDGTLYNADPTFRPLDDALLEHQARTYDATAGANDSPWARPNLNLLVLSELPQSHDATTGDTGKDGRAKNAVLNACRLLEGDDGVNGPGTWPALPTWAMVARRYDEPAVDFAGLVSAAGGTGQCCYDPTPNDNTSCDPAADAIDVCDWVQSRSDAALRLEVDAGNYVCGSGTGYVQTGAMHFGEQTSSNGVKKQIACHLAGRYNNSGNDPCEDGELQNTNVLGIMSCVRQRPDDIDPDMATFYYCESTGEDEDEDEDEDDNTSDPDNCTRLTICDDDIDNDGKPNDTDPCPYDADHDDPNTCPTDKTAEECTGIEWVDPNKSLYVITAESDDGERVCDQANDDDGDIEITECPNEGDACTVDKRLDGSPAYGRCSVGQIYCDATGAEHCQQLYNPMPEICNGLDDDCDGEIDNLATSWDDSNFSPFDPTKLSDYDDDGVDREAIHCYEKNVCRCDNSTLGYGGPGYEDHIMSWVPGSCECGEGLSRVDAGTDSTSEPQPEADSKPQAGCSSAGGQGRSGVVWLFVVGVVGLIRRGRFLWHPSASR